MDSLIGKLTRLQEELTELENELSNRAQMFADQQEPFVKMAESACKATKVPADAKPELEWGPYRCPLPLNCHPVVLVLLVAVIGGNPAVNSAAGLACALGVIFAVNHKEVLASLARNYGPTLLAAIREKYPVLLELAYEIGSTLVSLAREHGPMAKEMYLSHQAVLHSMIVKMARATPRAIEDFKEGCRKHLAQPIFKFVQAICGMVADVYEGIFESFAGIIELHTHSQQIVDAYLELFQRAHSEDVENNDIRHGRPHDVILAAVWSCRIPMDSPWVWAAYIASIALAMYDSNIGMAVATTHVVNTMFVFQVVRFVLSALLIYATSNMVKQEWEEALWEEADERFPFPSKDECEDDSEDDEDVFIDDTAEFYLRKDEAKADKDQDQHSDGLEAAEAAKALVCHKCTLPSDRCARETSDPGDGERDQSDPRNPVGGAADRGEFGHNEFDQSKDVFDFSGLEAADQAVEGGESAHDDRTMAGNSSGLSASEALNQAADQVESIPDESDMSKKLFDFSDFRAPDQAADEGKSAADEDDTSKKMFDFSRLEAPNQVAEKVDSAQYDRYMARKLFDSSAFAEPEGPCRGGLFDQFYQDLERNELGTVHAQRCGQDYMSAHVPNYNYPPAAASNHSHAGAQLSTAQRLPPMCLYLNEKYKARAESVADADSSQESPSEDNVEEDDEESEEEDSKYSEDEEIEDLSDEDSEEEYSDEDSEEDEDEDGEEEDESEASLTADECHLLDGMNCQTTDCPIKPSIHTPGVDYEIKPQVPASVINSPPSPAQIARPTAPSSRMICYCSSKPLSHTHDVNCTSEGPRTRVVVRMPAPPLEPDPACASRSREVCYCLRNHPAHTPAADCDTKPERRRIVVDLPTAPFQLRLNPSSRRCMNRDCPMPHLVHRPGVDCRFRPLEHPKKPAPRYVPESLWSDRPTQAVAENLERYLPSELVALWKEPVLLAQPNLSATQVEPVKDAKQDKTGAGDMSSSNLILPKPDAVSTESKKIDLEHESLYLSPRELDTLKEVHAKSEPKTEPEAKNTPTQEQEAARKASQERQQQMLAFRQQQRQRMVMAAQQGQRDAWGKAGQAAGQNYQQGSLSRAEWWRQAMMLNAQKAEQSAQDVAREELACEKLRKTAEQTAERALRRETSPQSETNLTNVSVGSSNGSSRFGSEDWAEARDKA